MNWDDLKFFLSVARVGGLTRARSTLGTSASTVSRRISSLEESLGATLFTRHAGGYELTDEGRLVQERLEGVESDIHAIQQEIHGSDQILAGSVRLATPVTIANLVVAPVLQRLRAEAPGISLEIATGIANINLTRREADLALRLTYPPHGRLTVRRVGRVEHALYASRSFIAENCPDKSMEQISQSSFILWDEALRSIPMAQWLDQHFRKKSAALVSNDLTTHIAAAKAGIGLAILPCYCARSEPELEMLIPPGDVMTRDLYLIMHEEVRHSARVRTVADFLVHAVETAGL